MQRTRQPPHALRRRSPTLAHDRARSGGDGLHLGALPNLLGYALRRAQLAVFADFLQAFAELDLRPAEFSALILIDANPGCKQSAAAEALGIMQPNFVALMDGLEAGGLARRTPAKSDRRSHALSLTAKGRHLLAHAMAVVARHEARVASGLTEAEHITLLNLLGRLEASATAKAAVKSPVQAVQTG